VLLPAVDLALPVTEVRLVAAGAQSQHPRRSSFGLASEAGWVGHRGRARVVLLSCGDLLLLGAVVRVDSVFEAHEREQDGSLPLAPLESIDQVRNYSVSSI